MSIRKNLSLEPYQLDAVKNLSNGKILCGGTGSGKSLTSLVYYCTLHGCPVKAEAPFIMTEKPKDLVIITTAKKRDGLEWEKELAHFGMSTNKDINMYDNDIYIDSWNNIKKYTKMVGAFFIFDEQRLVGTGAWVKAFLNIARKNQWILLSATPGDSWKDYIPVFVANGFYKNKTEFTREHIEFDNYVQFPKIKCYHNTGKLMRYRRMILVNMDYESKKRTVQHHIDIFVPYDKEEYTFLMKNRWNKEEERPIENASELCYKIRKVVNSDEQRVEEIQDIVDQKKRVIVFYNYDYELDILKSHDFGVDAVAEWNGHRHEEVPTTDTWIYLVQYTAGAEGWNCIVTDTIVFYSQNYSYKIMVQSAGRIDRMNTPYTDLYYYHIKSRSGIDLAIAKALSEKRSFNESGFTHFA